MLRLTVRGDGSVEVWQREGRTATDFAELLREIADNFESGNVKRVK